MRNNKAIQKNNAKQGRRDVKRAENVKVTAMLTGVSPREVNYVLSGERENPKVMAVFMEYQEGKTELIKKIEQLVPFL